MLPFTMPRAVSTLEEERERDREELLSVARMVSTLDDEFDRLRLDV